MKKTILFDLDGTLTDSGEGIINCAILALEHFHLPIPDRQTLRVFVGPPLHETFIKFGVPADKAEEAVAVYRSRYVPIGMFENAPYEGIRELLQTLKAQGHTLYVATSKPEWMAEEILKKFELDSYFDRICGATMDTSRTEKSQVIAYLLGLTGSAENAIMVGDTKFDVLGAAAHNIPTVGVSWGFREEEELRQSGADVLIHHPQELLQLL